MAQIQKKQKIAGQVLKNKTLQETIFTSVLTIVRDISQKNGKNPDKMCQLIFLKIYPQQQKQRHKNYLYIYLECQNIYSNSYLKLRNAHLLHLSVDMYILKFFLKKTRFCKVNFLR